MDLLKIEMINNGNFASGTESWKPLGDWPLTGEVLEIAGKNWYLMPNDETGLVNNSLCQDTILPPIEGSDIFTIAVTAKAYPRGGVILKRPKRLTANLQYWFTLWSGEDSWTAGGSFEVSVKPTPVVIPHRLFHRRPVTRAQLALMYDNRAQYDQADMLITDVSVLHIDLESYRPKPSTEKQLEKKPRAF